MFTEWLKEYLGRDISTSGTAAQVRSDNPGKFFSDAEVPLWMYKSLAQFMGVTTSTDLKKRIISRSGGNETVSDGSIILVPQVSDSAEARDGLMADQVGWRHAQMLILIRFQKGTSDPDKGENIARRLELLLDHNQRAASFHSPVIVPATRPYPPGIDPSEETNQSAFLCHWQSDIFPGVLESNTSEFTSRYMVEFCVTTGIVSNLPSD